MEMCNMVDPPTEWDDVISLGLQQWRKKTLQANNLCRLVFGCLQFITFGETEMNFDMETTQKWWSN
jgi:hypothetical protein